MHRIEHLGILDLQVLSEHAQCLLFLRAADVRALGERHDESLELPRFLFHELAARRDIATGRINSCFINIREHGKFHAPSRELQEIIFSPEGRVDLPLHQH